MAELPLRSVTVRRRGTLNVKVLPGSNHCGTANRVVRGEDGHNYMPCNFEVRVVCRPSLDSRGFLFDQAQITPRLEKLASSESTLSCELMSQSCAVELMKAIYEENPSCQILDFLFTFSPAPYLADFTEHYGTDQCSRL